MGREEPNMLYYQTMYSETGKIGVRRLFENLIGQTRYEKVQSRVQ